MVFLTHKSRISAKTTFLGLLREMLDPGFCQHESRGDGIERLPQLAAGTTLAMFRVVRTAEAFQLLH